MESYPMMSEYPVDYKSTPEDIEGGGVNNIYFYHINPWGTDPVAGNWGYYAASLAPSGNVSGMFYQEDGSSATAWRNSAGQWNQLTNLTNSWCYSGQRGEAFYYANWVNPSLSGRFVPPILSSGTPMQTTPLNLNANSIGTCSAAAGGYYAFSNLWSGGQIDVWRGQSNSKELLTLGTDHAVANERGDLAYMSDGASYSYLTFGHLYELPVGKYPEARRDIHPRNYPSTLLWPWIQDYSVNGDVILGSPTYNNGQIAIVTGKIGCLLSCFYANAGLDEDRYTLTSQSVRFDEVGNIHFLVFDNDTGLYHHVKLYHNIDLDGDGMADDWERYYFRNLNENANSDFDGDGVSNIREYYNGTVPNDSDTDNDGDPDGKDPDPVNPNRHTPMVSYVIGSGQISGDGPANMWWRDATATRAGDWDWDFMQLGFIGKHGDADATQWGYIIPNNSVDKIRQQYPIQSLDQIQPVSVENFIYGTINFIPELPEFTLPLLHAHDGIKRIPLSGLNSIGASAFYNYRSFHPQNRSESIHSSFDAYHFFLERGGSENNVMIAPKIEKLFLHIVTNSFEVGAERKSEMYIKGVVKFAIAQNSETGTITEAGAEKFELTPTLKQPIFHNLSAPTTNSPDATAISTDSLAPISFITPSGDPANAPVDAGNVPFGEPDGANEYTFDATTGKLTMKLKVYNPLVGALTTTQSENFKFELDAIGDSQLVWDAANPGGRVSVEGSYLTATATFNRLPQLNSDFGLKKARILYDSTPLAEAEYEVFFPRDSKNHPGGQQDAPNWFHYWSQLRPQGAVAVDYKLNYVEVGPYNVAAEVKAMKYWEYNKSLDKNEITVFKVMLGKYRQYGVGVDLVSGIDAFFTMIIHEAKHVEQISRADLLVPSGQAGTPWKYGWSFHLPWVHNHWDLGTDGKPGIAGRDDDTDTIIDNLKESGPGELGKSWSADTVGKDVNLGRNKTISNNMDNIDWPDVWPTPKPLPVKEVFLESEAINEADNENDENKNAGKDWGNPGKNHKTLNIWED